MLPKGKTAARFSHVIVPEGGHRGGRRRYLENKYSPDQVPLGLAGETRGLGGD